MAIHLATVADYLIRTSGLVNCTTGPSTTMLWAKQVTTSADPRTFWMQLDDPATYLDWCGLFGHGAFGSDIYGSCATGGVAVETTQSSRTLNTWYHVTLIRSLANVTFIVVNGKSQGSIVKNLTAATLAKEYVGNDTFSAGDISLAYCRQWSAALTNDEIAIEMQSASAVRTADLWGDWPLTSDILDTSGNGRDWTQVGASTFVADPVFPSNNSAATAVALTRSDSITLDMNDGAYAWYSYTPTTDDEVVLGFWAFYDFTKVDDLQLAVYQGPTSAPVVWPNSDNPEGGSSVPYQIPVTVGTAVYIRLFPHNIAATPFTSDIAITTVPGPSLSVQAGDIAVNDDLNGYPLALLSASDATPRLFMDVVAGGSGTVMPVTGEVFLQNNSGSNFKLYTNQYELIATVAYPQTGTNPLTDIPLIMPQTDGTSLFYSITNNVSSHAIVNAYSKVDGSVTGSWTLTQNGVLGGCPNPANTIFYYFLSTGAIRRWDLVNNVALADLGTAALPAGYARRSDLLYLADDTLIAWIQHSAATFNDTVLNYNATTGATIHTYDITTNNALNNGHMDHLCSAIDDPNSFWIWIHEGNSTSLSQFLNVEVSTGTVLNSPPNGSIAVMYQQGQYGGDTTSAPSARFGHSNSCPFWITRSDISPPTPTPSSNTREYLIRRERWFPVVSSEQHRLFFHKLQLYFEAGTGINDGQGSNPLVELDWSDDGGHTWSHLHLLESGPMGQKKRRIIQRMMGQSRERIYRVAVSDPVQWSLIDAFFDITEGTS